MTISERLNLIITEKNITKAELSKILGFSDGSISMYFNGRGKPGQKFLSLLQKHLNINPAWVLYAQGEMFLNQTEHDYNKELSGNSEKLKMTPEQLDLILKAVEKEPEFMNYAAKAVSGDETAKERLKKLL